MVRQGKPYPAILGGMLRFSPDSKRVAYGAQQDRQSFLVVDDKASKPYDGARRWHFAL